MHGYSVRVEVRSLVILDLMVAGGLHGITTTNCEATYIRLHGYGGGKTGIQQEQRAVKSMQMCECWLQAVHQCGNIVVRSYFDANLGFSR